MLKIGLFIKTCAHKMDLSMDSFMDSFRRKFKKGSVKNKKLNI